MDYKCLCLDAIFLIFVTKSASLFWHLGKFNSVEIEKWCMCAEENLAWIINTIQGRYWGRSSHSMMESICVTRQWRCRSRGMDLAGRIYTLQSREQLESPHLILRWHESCLTQVANNCCCWRSARGEYLFNHSSPRPRPPSVDPSRLSLFPSLMLFCRGQSELEQSGPLQTCPLQ